MNGRKVAQPMGEEKTILENEGVECWKTLDGDLRVYRIAARVLPHLTGYVHLLIGRDIPTTLIDAGSGEGDCLAQILRGVETVHHFFEPLTVDRIARIVLTHTHIDHFGGVHELKRLTGAEVLVHRYECRIVSAYNERASVSNSRFAPFCLESGIEPDQVEVVLNGFGFLPGRVASTPVDRVIDDGDQDGPIKYYHLPGHSAGGLALQVGPYFFTGDLLLSKTLTQIWPERLIPHTGLDHYLSSLARFAQLVRDAQVGTSEPIRIFPGHEEMIVSPESRVDLVMKSTFRRNERVLDILDQASEPMTVNEIAKKLYLTSHSSRTFFAICDVAARLEYLQFQGRVSVANYEQLATMKYPVYRWSALNR